MARPRIRSIKPEMWLDEKIGALSREARLLFIGLITMADDEGRLRALPAAILGHVFPYDTDAPKRLDGWLREIVDLQLVVTYTVDAVPYIAIRNWHLHQKVNRPSPSELPAPAVNPHDGSTEHSVNPHGGFTRSSLPRAQARVPILDPDPDPDVKQAPVAREPKRKTVDPDSLPVDFPQHLVDVADTVCNRLVAIWRERGGNEPTLRGVGLALARFPDRDHLRVVAELEHWALAGRGCRQAVKDWPKTYGTFLDRTPPGKPTLTVAPAPSDRDRRRAEDQAAMQRLMGGADAVG